MQNESKSTLTVTSDGDCLASHWHQLINVLVAEMETVHMGNKMGFLSAMLNQSLT